MALEERKADPLRFFRCSSDGQRKFLLSIGGPNIVHLRAGNQAGKTYIGAVAAVAMLRGVREVDGARMPLIQTPAVGAVLVKSYKQGYESAIQAVRDVLGKHPHHLDYANPTTVRAIYVKPDSSRSDEWRDWSRLLVLTRDGESPAGMRLDFVWADEPPDEAVWRELLARGRANRPFIRFITETPLDRLEWLWLKREFGPECLRDGGHEGKYEIRMNVYDNRALSHAHISALEKAYAKDPLREARLRGEYVDTTGLCPFDADGLRRWESRCEPGVAWGSDRRVEVWRGPEKGHPYFVLADPSAGIFDGTGLHDPAGVWVVDRFTKELVARYNGYMPPFELGRLCRRLGTEYNEAMLVWERNSGYGVSFYEALGDYGNLYVDFGVDRTRTALSQRLGWATTATSRGLIIGALQKAVIEDGLVVRSLDVVESLRDVILDPNNKIQAAPGCHDEDMILGGLAAHLLSWLPAQPVDETNDEKFRRMTGTSDPRFEPEVAWGF